MLKNTILNLFRIAKSLVAGLFIRKVTPTEAFADSPKIVFASASIVATPELPSMRLFPAGREFQADRYPIPDCYGMQMPGILYDPGQGLVLDKKRRAIEDPNQVPMRRHWYRWKPFFSRKVEAIPGNSFAFRSFGRLYYHLLIDHLPALVMLGKLDWHFDTGAKLLMPRPMTPTEKFFVPELCPEWLELCEVSPDRLYRLENYLYVSYLSQRSSACLPRFYLDQFRERFSPARPRQKNQRIYISRARSARRRVLNEDELYGQLQRFGFQRHFLEDMTVEDQLALFYDAEMVVAPHGAGLVNLLFSDRAKVLELFPGPLIRPHFYYLCKTLSHDYRLLCSRHDVPGFPRNRLLDFEEEFNGSTDDFAVDCRAVLKQVEDMTHRSVE